jgi:succinate dehydrogenase / fumarate reductase cytochrome b subunit
MILSGSVILAFGTAFYDFWVPEMVYKYVEVNPLDSTRYFHELAEKFESPVQQFTVCHLSFVLTLVAWFQFFNAVSWFQ